jgi:hypothetical protein
MQPWQIKILELEQTILGQISGFITQHKLGAFLALSYVLMAAGIVFIVLVCRGQRRNPRHGGRRNPPVISIEMPGPPSPPPPDDFNPFLPPHHYRDCDCDDERWD